MKNSFRILSATILTAIYCFAVSAAASAPISSNYKIQETTKQELNSSVISKSLFGLTSESESESSINNFNNFPVPTFKNQLEEHGSISKSIEQLYEVKYKQYFKFSINFLIQHRKTDIIFPFHYFW